MDNDQSFNYEKASEVLKEISSYFEFPQFNQTFGDNTENVKSIIQNMIEALDKKEEVGLVKKSLKVLKDLVVGTGGFLIGAGILALLGTISFLRSVSLKLWVNRVEMMEFWPYSRMW